VFWQVKMNNEERFDIVDENNQPTGETKQRSLVHRDGDWHRTAQIWVVSGDDKVLCDLRSEAVDSWPGYWDAIFGGHVPAGSGYLDTAVRELQEEVGITASAAELIHIADYVLDETDPERRVVNREFQRVYLLRTEQLEFIPAPTEVAQVRFIPFIDLATVITEGSMKFIPKPDYYQQMITRIATYIQD
jgi:isopentenyl-diphosphate Delta-isomerase